MLAIVPYHSILDNRTVHMILLISLTTLFCFNNFSIETLLHGLLVHFLITWHSSQSCIVSWDGSVSTPFSVSNGVRQGGILSPVLFTVYMDILLNMLKECGVGCYWDGVFVGALEYADDILLPFLLLCD